jgi:hypothetical protein
MSQPREKNTFLQFNGHIAPDAAADFNGKLFTAKLQNGFCMGTAADIGFD